MQDELWSPFPSSLGITFFLDTKEGGIEESEVRFPKDDFERRFNEPNFTHEDMNILDFEILLHLSPSLKIITRTRYNVWDLLGDVGGFNDGLHLVGYFLLSSYAAFSYKQSILKDAKVDGEALKKSSKHAQYENSVRYQTVVNKINGKNDM